MTGSSPRAPVLGARGLRVRERHVRNASRPIERSPARRIGTNRFGAGRRACTRTGRPRATRDDEQSQAGGRGCRDGRRRRCPRSACVRYRYRRAGPAARSPPWGFGCCGGRRGCVRRCGRAAGARGSQPSPGSRTPRPRGDSSEREEQPRIREARHEGCAQAEAARVLEGSATDGRQAGQGEAALCCSQTRGTGEGPPCAAPRKLTSLARSPAPESSARPWFPAARRVRGPRGLRPESDVRNTTAL